MWKCLPPVMAMVAGSLQVAQAVLERVEGAVDRGQWVVEISRRFLPMDRDDSVPVHGGRQEDVVPPSGVCPAVRLRDDGVQSVDFRILVLQPDCAPVHTTGSA